MPAAGTIAIPPPILWAQRAELLIVTVAVECKDEKYVFTEDSLHFTGIGKNTDKAYDVTLNFTDKIVPDDVTTKHTAQCNLQFQIPRKTPGAYWNSLTTDKKKPHFLKIDFNMWVDEDLLQDEVEETGMGGGMGGMAGMGGGMGGMGGMGGGAGGEDMMKYMNMFGQGGAGGAGGADSKHMFDDLDEAEDSDDEELPNLE